MSFHVLFDFSTGLAKTLRVPKGTVADLVRHVDAVEKILGIKRTTFGTDKQIGWDEWDPNFRAGFPNVDNKTLCGTAEQHNRWVGWVWERFEDWAKSPVRGGDRLTPYLAKKFWPGLRRLTVEPDRWTSDYYRARMDELYEAMRGRPAATMVFDGKPLEPRQASAVINLFDQYLDVGDLRLEVPKGCDYLLPSSAHEGGYDWCERCGAIDPNDYSCRKRGCPVAKERSQ